jgi:hypothetical protein
MQIPVLIEQVDQNGYRVKGCEPFSFSTEGATREEALQKFKDRVNQQLASGLEMVQVEVGRAERPWERFRGTWKKGDPVIEAWKKCVQEYRQQVEEDPDIQ